MKKLALLSLVVLSMYSTKMNAQSKAEAVFEKYRFGLFLGPTFNSFKPIASTAESNGAKYSIKKNGGNVGFSFGLTGELNMNERYTVFLGLGLDWRGGKIAVARTDSAVKNDYVKSANVSYKHQFLTVPLGLKMKAFDFDKFKIFAQTSVDLGILLSQKGNYEGVPSTGIAIKGENVKLAKLGYAKGVPVNLGWSVGIGTEYALSEKNAAYAAILYRNGFVDATSPQSNNSGLKFADGNIRQNTIAIRIGYYF
jgi:opacity protein-like surface antigen